MATRRAKLTDLQVEALKSRATRYTHADPELPGHYVRVTSQGSKSFVAVARDPNGKQQWVTIGPTTLFTIEQARERARAALIAVREGADPSPKTFKAAADDYFKRHVIAKGRRTADEIERVLNVYVLPKWAGRDFASLRRSDIADLLDHVEDNHGPRQADVVLSVIRAIANFYAKRHDDYLSPFVKDMKRSEATARDRILTDAELRTLWQASDDTFGDLLRVALLTAQRREKVSTMRWADVSDEGVWTIPTEHEREKGHGGTLALPEAALSIIRARPVIVENPYVFPGRGKHHFVGWSPCKAMLDAKLRFDPSWTIHDLRRTARSLMSRAGVTPEIAERVMGHKQPGVKGIYDRHEYHDEKATALRKLAALVETIVHPSANVVGMDVQKRKRR